MKNKSKLLLVSWVLTALYLIYLVIYFTNAGASSTDEIQQLGVGLAATIVYPHAILVFIALIFNVLAWAMNKRGFALTSGILYAVSIALMPIYFMFVIIQMILSFVAYAKMKPEVAVVQTQQ